MAAFSRLQLAAALIEYDNDLDDPDAIQRSANDSAIFSHLRKRNLTPRTKSIHGLDFKSSTDHLQVPLPAEGNPDPQASRKSRASISTLQNPFRGELMEDEGIEDDEPEEPEVDLSSWGLDAILPQKPKEKHGRKTSHAKTIDLAAPFAPVRPSGELSRPPMRKTATTDEFGALHGQRRDVSEPQRQSISWDRRSATSQQLLDDTAQTVPFPQSEGEIFAPPLPPMSRASRFDPKIQAHARGVSVMSRGSGELLGIDGDPRPRTISGGTLATLGSQMPRLTVDGGDSFARSRRVSNASYGSQYLLGTGDQDSVEPGFVDDLEDPEYTRAGLLRPKILVMPSPLQSNEAPSSDPSVTPDGFQRSQNGFPFPAGAQTASRPGIRPLSSMLTSTSLTGTPGNNPFTANPRQSLTLSQLTFRNSLMVGGQRDAAFDDLEQHLARAQEDGEQVPVVEEDEEVDEKLEEVRPAGKLFGRSLIDDLEARKTEIRSKQRTFMGDQRVSMMARSQPTFIDVNELQRKPGLSPSGSNSRRRTLIDLDEGPSGLQGRVEKSTSVFGVDTVWERELQKLKEIEQQEAAVVAEDKRRQEAIRATELAKKEKKAAKGKARKRAEQEVVPQEESHLPDVPPTLPAFELRPAVRKVPDPESEESDSNDDDEDVADAPQQSRGKTWYAGDSDEEQVAPKLSLPNIPSGEVARQENADSDDDDVPLNQIPRARLAKSTMPDSDEEEDKPLAAVLEKMKGSGTSLSPVRSPQNKHDDDDDEVPLAMRRLTTMGSFQSFNQRPQNRDDDDNRPLGLKMQQPWAPQQMIPQFNPGFPAMSMGAPSIMGMPAMSFMQGPVMPNPFFNTPMQEPQPQPPQIFGRVDAWRRTVE